VARGAVVPQPDGTSGRLLAETAADDEGHAEETEQADRAGLGDDDQVKAAAGEVGLAAVFTHSHGIGRTEVVDVIGAEALRGIEDRVRGETNAIPVDTAQVGDAEAATEGDVAVNGKRVIQIDDLKQRFPVEVQVAAKRSDAADGRTARHGDHTRPGVVAIDDQRAAGGDGRRAGIRVLAGEGQGAVAVPNEIAVTVDIARNGGIEAQDGCAGVLELMDGVAAIGRDLAAGEHLPAGVADDDDAGAAGRAIIRTCRRLTPCTTTAISRIVVTWDARVI